MTDRNWLLNPTAVHAAKACISIIQDELGIRLKLSHPQFLEMIQEYVELTESPKLQEAYIPLAMMAGIDHKSAQILKSQNKVVEIPVMHKQMVNAPMPQEQYETVTYNGKMYRRYSDEGLEFKGLYRGQPHYA